MSSIAGKVVAVKRGTLEIVPDNSDYAGIACFQQVARFRGARRRTP